MSPDFSKTLWSDTDRNRFFLIPDDRELPSGDFELKTVTGRHQQVEENAITEFEIGRDEAKTWLKEQFGELLSSARKGITDAIKNWRSPQNPSPPQTESPTEAGASTTSNTSRTANALSELDALLNQSAEQMRTKSSHALEHLRAISNALNSMFEGAISPEAEKLAQAQTQAQVLHEHLQALGIQVDVDLKTFPERLHSLYFADRQKQSFQENADQLEAIANQIEQTSKLAVQAIRAMARQQRKHAAQSKPESDRKM